MNRTNFKELISIRRSGVALYLMPIKGYEDAGDKFPLVNIIESSGILLLDISRYGGTLSPKGHEKSFHYAEIDFSVQCEEKIQRPSLNPIRVIKPAETISVDYSLNENILLRIWDSVNEDNTVEYFPLEYYQNLSKTELQRRRDEAVRLLAENRKTIASGQFSDYYKDGCRVMELAEEFISEKRACEKLLWKINQ